MKEIYFVTSSKDKLREAKEILGIDIQSISLDIPEIQALYVKDVVEAKAKAAYERTQKPLIVEDTGLYIKAWNDFPGALIRWAMKTLNNEGISSLIKTEENKKAYAETYISFCDGNNLVSFGGEIQGEIVSSPRGENGFGWDKIFQPAGYDKTFAEMDSAQKNSMSMRKEAFLKLKNYLKLV